MGNLIILKGLWLMEKKIALFIVTIMLLSVSSSAVFALSPMGPPKALFGLNRWGVGIEYGNQTMDLEAVGIVSEIIVDPLDVLPSVKYEHNIDNLKSNILMVSVGYGLSDNWDAFVRLGLADAKGDIEQTFPDNAPPNEYKGYDGSFGLGWGIGTRATFWQDDKVSWGGLLQITWLEPDSSSISLSGEPRFSGDAEIDVEEVQIAVGPTWRVNESISIYGGPFLHFVDGDLDISGRTVDMGTEILMETKGDIEEKSQFGGYVGAHLDMDENTSCYIECQLTKDAWGIGIGAARRF
jgi:hypothetical protein